MKKKSMWQLAQKFLGTAIKKKFDADLVTFMEKQKFSVEDTEYFCLMLKEVISFYTVVPRIEYQFKKEEEKKEEEKRRKK